VARAILAVRTADLAERTGGKQVLTGARIRPANWSACDVLDILREPFDSKVESMPRPHPIPLVLALLSFITIATPARRAAAERQRCGPNTCKEGTTCCNKGCGICVAPGEACIALFCFWGRPKPIDANENPTAGIYDQITAGFGLRNSQFRFGGSEVGSTTGHALHVRSQHRLGKRSALRLGATGSTIIEGAGAVGGERLGWSMDFGTTYRLPAFRRILGSALTFDAEFLDGPVAGDSLAPVAFTDARTTTLGAGVAIEDMRNAVPITAHARFLRSAVDNADDRSLVDLGLTVSSNLDWLFWRGGQPIPFGVRLSYGHAREVTSGEYREHEFGAGVYYFGRTKTRIGVDFEASYQSLDENLSARTLGAMLRMDYYWDANH